MESFSFLPDPQTNGGLLIAVRPDALKEVQDCLNDAGYTAYLEPIGMMKAHWEKLITVIA